MASTFPAAIANEPPPLDASCSEDEDSDDFRSHGLKLDVPSGEPTPVSTPSKRPINKSPEDKKSVEELEVKDERNQSNEGEDVVLRVVSPPSDVSSSETSPSTDDKITSELFTQVNGEISPGLVEVETEAVKENGIHVVDETTNDRMRCDKQSLHESEKESEQFNKPTSASREPEVRDAAASANDYCDNSSNDTNSISEQYESHSQNDSLSPIHDDCESAGDNNNDQIYINDLSSGSAPSEVNKLSRESDESSTDYENANGEHSEFLEFQMFDADCSKLVPSRQNHVHEEGPVPSLSKKDESLNPDDFGDFQFTPDPVVTDPDTKVSEAVNFTSGDRDGSFEDDDDDEFGDFAHVPAQPETQVSASPATSALAQDFADFPDSSFQSCDVPAFKPSISSDFKLIANKIDSVIKSLFVIDASLPVREVEKLTELSISKDCIWTRVQDFEQSKGLLFKWRNSLTEQRLHQSLNIDKSNIMYHHEKWGIEVPKFVQSQPLDPQKSDIHNSMVNNNNNNNNLSDCQDHDKSPSTSTEAQEILRQLPDLSYMRANTLVFPQSSPSGL